MTSPDSSYNAHVIASSISSTTIPVGPHGDVFYTAANGGQHIDVTDDFDLEERYAHLERFTPVAGLGRLPKPQKRLTNWPTTRPFEPTSTDGTLGLEHGSLS